MNSELLLKVSIFFTLGAHEGMGLPDLVGGGGVVFSPHHLLSKRLRASDPFILLQSLRNLKKKKNKGRQNVNHS